MTEREGDTLSVLTSSSRLAKRWRPDGGIDAYEKGGIHFKLDTVRVANIRELAQFVAERAKRAEQCFIRGRYLGDAAQLEHYPDDFKRGSVLRRQGCFADQALHTIMLDVDGFEPLVADPVAEPAAAIDEFIYTALPEAFREAAYCWQLSGSAGHPDNAGVLKVHVWFWLAKPATSAALRAFFTSLGKPVDVSLFQPVQIHYTADPVFQAGIPDPVEEAGGARQGFAQKPRDAVVLDIAEVHASETPTRQQKLAEAAQNDPTAQALNERGLLKGGATQTGGLHIVCPFEAEHEIASSPSSTIYFPAHTGGFAHGHFDCKHAPCIGRTDEAFLNKLGLADDYANDFDFESEPSAPAQEQAECANSFQLASQRAQAPIRPDLIQGVIPDAEFGIIYGKSGSGKSFAAIDLGYHLARGVPWRGRKVKQRSVFYIAAEGAEGVRKRTLAYSLYHGVAPSTPFYTRERGLNLHVTGGWQEVARDIRAITGGELGVIFIDTLSRSIPGVDENSAKDMSQVIANCQRLARMTACMVIVIAHAGKNDEQGVRGSSALRAAADFEIAVSRHLNTQWRCLKLTKSKDDIDGTEFGFTLESVPVGQNTDGDEVFSAVALPSDARASDAGEGYSGVKGKVYDAYLALAEFTNDGWVGVESIVDHVLPDDKRKDRHARYNTRRYVSGDAKLEIFSLFDGKVSASTPQFDS